MPWCHECEKEHKEGLEYCPDCGDVLYENIPPSMMEPEKLEWSFKGPFSSHAEKPLWPVDENGEPVPPVFLTQVFGTQIDYEMKSGMLEAYGIPVIRNVSALGNFGKIVLGFSGTGMEILVPATMFDDAVSLLSDSLDDGEEE